MGKINGCLKAVFIGFNSLFTAFGIILIWGLIKMNGSSYQMETMDVPSIIWVWVFAVCLLVISLLGSQAARTENKSCLKLFAGLMVIGMILMLIFGVLVAVSKNKALKSFKSAEDGKIMIQDQQIQHLQPQLNCCGWSSVHDWGSNIPDSCSCTSSYGQLEEVKCKSKPVELSGPSEIYSKSCGEVLASFVEYAMAIALGIFFGLFFIALIGLIIAINMINQIGRHDNIAEQAFALNAY